MTLAWRWMIVGMLSLFPITSHALALGKLKVFSALNEPLNAEIEFTSATENELKGLTASLASRADFNAAGVDRLPFLSEIKFIVSKRPDGRYFLELHSDQQLDEPFLHLLLQIEWPGGRLVREYTALIDPPYKISSKPAPVETPTIPEPAPAPELAMQPPTPPVPEAPAAPSEAPVTAEAPKEEIPAMAKPEEPVQPEQIKAEQIPPAEEVAKEAPPAEVPPEPSKLGPPELAQGAVPQEPAAPTVEPLEAAPRAEAAPAPEEQPSAAPESQPAPAGVWATMTEYDVKKGDTLWRIAESARGENNKEASIEQVMLAIYRTNKNAFFGNNVNNLKAGKILKMPEIEEVTAVSAPDARREFRAQYDAWQEYKLKLASASGAINVTETAEAAAPKMEEAPAMKPAAPEPTKKAEAKAAAPTAADKGKQDELLKIVRSTLQQEKSTPDKKVSETESPKETAAREQQALADRAATLEESLESKRLENKDLTEKVGVVRSQLKKESRLIELESQSLATQQKQVPEQKTPETKPVETVTKPAEKPVEKPAAAKTEEPIKAEALPPVAKPARVAPKKRAPVAPPPPKVEKDFLSTVLEAVQSDLLVPAVIGVVVLLSGVIALVYLRRRQKSIAEFEESILSADAISTEQPATTGNVSGQPAVATTGGDTSFLSDFSQGGMGNIHTDEVDPVAEAEVYLAYGRDETAEEILKEAMVKNPDRQELKLKLLEIYHQRNDVAAFETLAEELYAALGGRGGKIWEKVEEMGRKLNPENPMFRGGAPARGGSPAPSAQTAAPASKTAAPSSSAMGTPPAAAPEAETAGDFDFDMASPATEALPSDNKTVAETNFESLDLGTASDNAIDFDAGGKDEVAGGIDLGAPGAEPARGGNEIKWEPEPVAAPSATTDVVLDSAPPAGEGQASGQWDETATKLDLAKAYIDMGDAEGARSILQEVMTEGNDAQKKQAQELSTQIA